MPKDYCGSINADKLAGEVEHSGGTCTGVCKTIKSNGAGKEEQGTDWDGESPEGHTCVYLSSAVADSTFSAREHLTRSKEATREDHTLQSKAFNILENIC